MQGYVENPCVNHVVILRLVDGELWERIRGASLVTQMVKNLPAMQETRVQSLGQENPLENEIGPHSSIFAWKIPGTEEPDRLQSMDPRSVEYD